MAGESATIDRSAVLQTPAGSSGITFTHLAGRDEISRCFTYKVGFVVTGRDLNPLDVLGGPLSLQIERSPSRWMSGIVSDFRVTGVEERRVSCEATVRPWLWLLGNTTDCRIFQKMSVVEIVEEIFSKYDAAKFEKRLEGSYQPREYCVQFDESDLDFVQRLLEHEGIFYFFEHAEGQHTLVLADSMSKLKPVPDYETVDFQPRGYPMRSDKEYMTEWLPGTSVRPGTYVHTDYDFEKPGADLMAKSSHPFSHKEAGGENYRQPGTHLDIGHGEAIASIRREELQAPHERARGEGNVRGLHPGCTFTLQNFPQRGPEPGIPRGARRHGTHRSGVRRRRRRRRRRLQGRSWNWRRRSCPSARPGSTPRPVMRGPQTATVVGPSGEEIFTDKYARVKVQFHWDRLGKKDQNSSCFVRVSQGWAGSNWGFIQIPRIGQEVIVEFIEGDPDRPIITGRVYNAAQMPPYGLPGNATQSGFKSNSSKGGGGWNELRFEDKAGLRGGLFPGPEGPHASRQERSQPSSSSTTRRIASTTTRNTPSASISTRTSATTRRPPSGVNRTVRIGSNDTETVGVNRSLTVGSNETIAIGANSSETIGANHSQTVSLVQTHHRWARPASTRSGRARREGRRGPHASPSAPTRSTRSASPTAGRSAATRAYRHRLAVRRHRRRPQRAVGQDDATDHRRLPGLTVAKDDEVEIGNNGLLKIGKNLLIEAGESIVIKCGSAMISMKKDGTISIEGKDISVNGSGKINVKASSDITMKGSKINQN